MNPEIAEKWALALESGKYTQGTGRLKARGNHCCLGVLCELALESGLPLEVEDSGEDGGITRFDDSADVLPGAVIEWADMKSAVGIYDGDGELTDDNDLDTTFPEIATIIREHVADL